MKIFRVTEYDYDEWRHITEICNVDVIHIERDSYIGRKSIAGMLPKTDKHYITYDDEQFRQTLLGIGNPFLCDLDLLKNKILSRIENDEDIILLSNTTCFNYGYDEYFAGLKAYKNFKLHIITTISCDIPDEEYKQFLRFQGAYENINSFCYINYHTVIPVSDDEEDIDTWQENQNKFRNYYLSILLDIIDAITQINNHEKNIYNHKHKTYTPIHLSGNFRFLEIESKIPFENITNGYDKMLCKTFRRYRDAYIASHNLNFVQKECTYNGPCRGVCKQCDNDSSYIWYLKNEITVEENDQKYGDPIIEGKINGLERLRINNDGKGVRTLILMCGCQLKCKYCGNSKIAKFFPGTRTLAAADLGDYLHKDGIYFEKTGGGVTFGGGEPLLQADFIVQFGRIYSMWNIDIETSLNIEWSEVEKLLDIVDVWHIDIKDMDPDIYIAYTGCDNSLVTDNLARLIKLVPAGRLHIRVPEIAGFNTKSNIENSVSRLRAMGFTDIEVFSYVVEK